jgi:hypothetical protein
MDIDGVDIVIYGSGRTSLSLLARSWLEDGRLVGIAVDPDFPTPVAASIRVAVSPEAEGAALAGFDSFHAQIDDEEHEGSLSSTIIALPDEFNVHNFRATLGGAQYRVIAIEDPFPLLLIPVVVGICAIAASRQHKATMNTFRDLARDCMNQGGTPTIVAASGASVTFDGRMKIDFSGKPPSFICVMPQANQ